MVFFSTTGLLLHVALFRLGTTHDCAIGQAGPSIWSRLPPIIHTEGPMRRIGLVLVLALALASPVAEAQATKVYRIGFLGLSSVVDYAQYLEAFRQGLGSLGYEEGRNVVIDYRWAEGRAERLPGLAEELVRLNPDVLVTHAGGVVVA